MRVHGFQNWRLLPDKPKNGSGFWMKRCIFKIYFQIPLGNLNFFQLKWDKMIITI